MSNYSYTKSAGRGSARYAGLATGPQFSKNPKIAPQIAVTFLTLPDNLISTIIKSSDSEQVKLVKQAKIDIEMQIKQILYTNTRVNQVIKYYGHTRPDVMWAVFFDCQRQFSEIGLSPIKLPNLPSLVNSTVPRLLSKLKSLNVVPS